MKRQDTIRVIILNFCMMCAISLVFSQPDDSKTSESVVQWAQYRGYQGSLSCRECHQRFHQLWGTSFHGLAMQPFRPQLALDKLKPQTDAITIDSYLYIYQFDGSNAWIVEKSATRENKYQIFHALGGKNVFYFLTLLDKGRLQTLPLAYDVRRQQWYDMAESGVRHFLDISDEPINWKEWPYTFNTACYQCHVSQLTKNYNPETDTYNTTWVEPGINCETCHGPAEEHIRICRTTTKEELPKDLKQVIVMQNRGFSAQQVNANCAPCHAKMVPITNSFMPGDRYFDHFELTTLEHRDFFPDGRDLGENYTYTLWRMSPCVKSGKLDCMFCHTSSGRYRFKDPEKANQACLPCHQDDIKDVAEHTHHKLDGEGSKCIACHMPMTEFARMKRSDHSMRPPMPAATIAFKSPNACNICHTDKDAVWSDEWVRKWRTHDYQKPTLYVAGLVDAARKHDWRRLDDILQYIKNPEADEVFTNSLLRLIRYCPDDKIWSTVIDIARTNPSPLVRATASDMLSDYLNPESLQVLLSLVKDDFRLVRIRAAASLAAVPDSYIPTADREAIKMATDEFIAAMMVRPDDGVSYYNLGNFYMTKGQYETSISNYARALQLRPDLVEAYVNVSLVYNRMGENERAEQSLRNALNIAPDNVAANLNLGMLLAELGKMDESEQAFRKVLKSEPRSAQAAYNLAIILTEKNKDESLDWSRKAAEFQPDNPKYSYSYAYYLNEQGKKDAAIKVLERMIYAQTLYTQAYYLLGDIYEQQGKTQDAINVYRKGATNENLPERDRHALSIKLSQLEP